MPHGRTTRSLTRCATACVFMALACAQAGAGTVSIEVLDRDGKPLDDVAVYALPANPAALAATASPTPHAVMDQAGLRFVPHTLVVQTGTLIEFPNSDSVNHHVYSFSPAKSFELPLYKGSVHAPLSFGTAGLVTLGCNIHDSMLGYILVVDTPWFAITDGNGHALIASLPDDQYAIHVWTPRAREQDAPAAQTVSLTGQAGAALAFRFTDKLFPSHERGSSLTWSEY
jgi:plastocyanin